MPLKANDYHNHLKLKTKAQICYFLLFLSVFLSEISCLPFIHALGEVDEKRKKMCSCAVWGG
jgi:hypothetical protein